MENIIFDERFFIDRIKQLKGIKYSYENQWGVSDLLTIKEIDLLFKDEIKEIAMCVMKATKQGCIEEIKKETVGKLAHDEIEMLIQNAAVLIQ